MKELTNVVNKLNSNITNSDVRTSSSCANAPRVMGTVNTKKLFQEEVFNETALKEKMF